MKKRLFTGLLAAMMVASMMATTVFAVEQGTEENLKSLEEVNRIYEDPNSSVLDIIRATNPNAYNSMTAEQRADFANINYQQSKKISMVRPRDVVWLYNYTASIDSPRSETIKYGSEFNSYILGFESPNCSFVGITCSLYDLTTDKRVAFSSEYGKDTNSVSLSETKSDFISGRRYQLLCEVYGYDPRGNAFVDYAPTYEDDISIITCS